MMLTTSALAEAGSFRCMSVATARAAADMFAEHFADARVEKLAVAHLDSDGRAIAVDAREGSLEAEIELPVRQILADALRLGSSSLIIAHNHPSGDASPSEADVQATRVLAAAARALGLQLRDHLIFAGSECRSFRGLGLL